MSNFEVARREKQEPTPVLLVRVILCFVLFTAGLLLIGIGASRDVAVGPYLFVGGIVAVALAFGLPMVGARER
ncbi:hypothetical protein [Antribacter gilvus]|uniref:hypothetical protein n=1 Tax=Antribacter gilvus TaxID=2304675 RepID=UPI000F7AEEC7|nr:hypothetical protein [Antribacter gilvus]